MSPSSSSADIMSSSPSSGAGPRHLQVFQHRLQLLEQLARGVLVAGAREILQPVDHALEIPLAAACAYCDRADATSCCGFFRICSASACRNLSIAARNWSISFLISSSLAPRSSAWRSASCACAQRLLGFATCCRLRSAPPCPTAARRRRADRRRFGVVELVVDRAQAEIDAGFGRELLRRDRQRVERGQHERLGVGVEREDCGAARSARAPAA